MKFITAVAFLLSAWLPKAPPISEPYTWKNVEIVGGGFVTGLVFHPKQKDLLYARTDIGGAYRWNSETKRWIPLLDWLSKEDWNLYGIESIGIDPTDAKRLYLAVGTYTNNWAGNGAILRSTDYGAHFQRTSMPFKLGGNEDGRSIGERLAVNPNRNQTLYFGSRHEGLWRSDDFGATWQQVKSFPDTAETKGIGIGFVLFHEKTVFAAVAGTKTPLYRSDDAGQTWSPVIGQPNDLIPHHGVFAADGLFYGTYSNAPGPNGASSGAVWKWNPQTGIWSDITPVTSPNFGFAGLSVDAKNPKIVVVSSLDKWSTGDEIWRSTDGGGTWHSYKPTAERDASGAPFLLWGRKSADLGHWIGDLEIDPFRSGHLLYVTGATIWGSDDADKLEGNLPTHWTVRAQGLEETAVTDLMSPPSGAPLISAMGDIGGFRHDNLEVVPPVGKSISPLFNTTISLDFAQNVPRIMAISGNGTRHAAISQDGGATWTLVAAEPTGTRGAGKIALSADGTTLIWSPQSGAMSVSGDNGTTWTACDGVPDGAIPTTDRTDIKTVYALVSGTLYKSTDSGRHFAKTGLTVPMSGDVEMKTAAGMPNEIWFCLGGQGLWLSRDGGVTASRRAEVNSARSLGFGKPAAGKTRPTLFLNGTVSATAGVFRSDDEGKTWVRIDDAAHQFGTMGVVCGDPRVYGRVYVGTNGRGVLVANPLTPNRPVRSPQHVRR